MDDSFIDLSPWATWNASSILFSIFPRKLQKGKYNVRASDNRFYQNNKESGYYFQISNLELGGYYSAKESGGYMSFFKFDSCLCSIGIGYEINIKAKKGSLYFDPNAPYNSTTSDDVIKKVLDEFYQNRIQISNIEVQKHQCSLEADWGLGEYCNGKISIYKPNNM